MYHMNIQWHTPSSAELDLVDKVLSTFLGAELDALDKFVKGEEMERCARLWCSLAEMNLTHAPLEVCITKVL